MNEFMELRPRQNGKTFEMLQDMRQAINQKARGRYPAFGVGHLVRQVFDAAEYQGLSGEDRYVLLAHTALESLERLQEQLRQELSLSPKQWPPIPGSVS